jgi:hypothetical protein
VLREQVRPAELLKAFQRSAARHGLALGIIVLHWVGILAEIWLLSFVSGATLAFYLPGALIVRLNPGLFDRTSRIEQIAMSVIMSVAYVTVAAFVLDFTSPGITRITLAVATTLIVPVSVVIEAWRDRPAAIWRSRQFAVELASVAMLAIAWIVVFPTLGDLSAGIDRMMISRPERGFSAFSATCQQLPGSDRDEIEFTIINRSGADAGYRLTIQRDTTLVAAVDLHVPVQDEQLVYKLQVDRGWKRVYATLETTGRRRSEVSMVTHVPANGCALP